MIELSRAKEMLSFGVQEQGKRCSRTQKAVGFLVSGSFEVSTLPAQRVLPMSFDGDNI